MFINKFLHQDRILRDPAGDATGSGAGTGTPAPIPNPVSATDLLDSVLAAAGDPVTTGTTTQPSTATTPTPTPTPTPDPNMIEVPDDDQPSTLDALLDDVIPEPAKADGESGDDKGSGEGSGDDTKTNQDGEAKKPGDTEPDGSDGKRYFMTKTKYEKLKTAESTLAKIVESTNVDLTNPESLEQLQSTLSRGNDFFEMTRDYLNVEGGSPANFANYLLAESKRVETETGFDPANPGSGGISPARTLVIELLAKDEPFAEQLTTAAGSEYLVNRFADIYAKHAGAPENSDGESIRASVEWLCKELGIDTKVLTDTAQNTAARRAEQLERENAELRNRQRKESATIAYQQTDAAIYNKMNELVDNYLKSTAPKLYAVKHSDEGLTQLASDVRIKVLAEVRKSLKDDTDFRRRAQVELKRLQDSGGKNSNNLISLYENRVKQMFTPIGGKEPKIAEVVKSQFALYRQTKVGNIKSRAERAGAVATNQPPSRLNTGDPTKVVDFTPQGDEDPKTTRLRVLSSIFNS